MLLKVIINLIISIVIGGVIFAGFMMVVKGPMEDSFYTIAENDVSLDEEVSNRNNDYQMLLNKTSLIYPTGNIRFAGNVMTVYEGMSCIIQLERVGEQYPEIGVLRDDSLSFRTLTPNQEYLYDHENGLLYIFNAEGTLYIYEE
jgi:hypothetical protein